MIYLVYQHDIIAIWTWHAAFIIAGRSLNPVDNEGVRHQYLICSYARNIVQCCHIYNRQLKEPVLRQSIHLHLCIYHYLTVVR